MTLIRVRSRLTDARGMTLIELLVVMLILVVVIGALTQLFVAGIRSESDQTTRAQAQIDARTALDQLRREVHCASAVSSNPNTDWQPVSGPPQPTQAITIALGSYCQTNPSGATAYVTWCTSGTGPYKFYRYWHGSDSTTTTAAYATACPNTPVAPVTRRLWARDIVNYGTVTGGKIFQNVATPTLPAMSDADLSFGPEPPGGSLGSAGSNVTIGYLVDPVVTGYGEQPGVENLITIKAGTVNKAVLVDWTTACAAYAQNALVTSFKIYTTRTTGAEQLIKTQTSSGCATTTWTDTGSGSASGDPVGSTRTKISVTLPVRADNSTIRQISLPDDLTLRNTPR